ncbi:ABC transporter ATP-binding protein [Paenibacillus paeoniae]|uniref:ABC transporter ATP-binding protein n=1 Tax=Paenibacillus paeoniae TaxID=2292705 RepID=A0A371PIS7_9BACL|nr:ABC transporter ATP-binding protein [Paenibacillus paeoniae]REK76122.1 ABC transporter ATP-binding protein [Paenibacillus paeoniae]
MDPVLEMQAVGKRYGSKSALENISFKAEAGRIIGLLGSNGSGKTTIMNIASGIVSPNSGQARICGEPVGVQSKAMTSFMPDKPLTESWMRIRDAIAFYHDFYADFDMVKAQDMIAFMGLQGRDKITSLSKGMNERLQLTLALSRNAKLYLLDEPIGGVDPVAREKILDAILQYYNENSCLIISTHLVTDIERIFDEVIFVKNGQLALHEEVDQLRMTHGKSVVDLFKEVYAQ